MKAPQQGESVKSLHLKRICLGLTYQCKTLICLGHLLVVVKSKNVDVTFWAKLN